VSNPVEVWQGALSENPEECELLETLISPGELERAQRFRHASGRLRFIQRRAWLRRILSHATSLDPVRLKLGLTPFGKPTLLNGPHSLFFNMASSRDLMICAVSREGPVGIDLEWIDPALETLPVASEHFSSTEYAMLRMTSIHRQRRLFYQLWTAREAYLKGVGCGLSIPLREIKVTSEDSAHGGAWTICCRTVGGEAWRGIELPIDSQYVATLATTAHAIAVRDVAIGLR
jgi:4'-phosphopantetheinyl transferase